jgi:uncharacterized protein YndB with AHSA1/START domain
MTDMIEREQLLPAPAERVWDLVTGHGWLADEVELELVPGGEARFRSDDAVKNGWVEDALAPGDGDDGGRLVFWWADEGDLATRVELTLEPVGEGATRLRVVESRPLEDLDVVGIPMPGTGEQSYGPAMLAAA